MKKRTRQEEEKTGWSLLSASMPFAPLMITLVILWVASSLICLFLGMNVALVLIVNLFLVVFLYVCYQITLYIRVESLAQSYDPSDDIDSLLMGLTELISQVNDLRRELTMQADRLDRFGMLQHEMNDDVLEMFAIIEANEKRRVRRSTYHQRKREEELLSLVPTNRMPAIVSPPDTSGDTAPYPAITKVLPTVDASFEEQANAPTLDIPKTEILHAIKKQRKVAENTPVIS